MTAIPLMQFAICLSCVISSFGFDEFSNNKMEGNGIYKKLGINGKQKNINNFKNFGDYPVAEVENRTSQNNYSEIVFNKIEPNVFLENILTVFPDVSYERAQERVKRSLSNRGETKVQASVNWSDRNYSSLSSMKSNAEVKTKSAAFKKANKSYNNPFLFLQPHVFDQNQKQYQHFVPNSKDFVNPNERNENVTIFSFIDQNGNLNFRDNFTAKLLNAIGNGSNKELIKNITKIASQTLKPEKFAGNRWSSDWFEVSLKNQPSNDVKISNFNRLLGLDINDSSEPFRNKPTNSNFSLIQILKDMIQQQGDSPKEFTNNHFSETKPPSIGNVINSLDSKTYSNGEILNYIVDKIKRTSLDLSQSSKNQPQIPLNFSEPQIGDTMHEFPTTKLTLDSQIYIPEEELNLRFPQSSIDTRPTQSTNTYNSFVRDAEKGNEIDNHSLIDANSVLRTQPTKTFSLSLESVQFSLPQQLIETTVQIYPSKIILHSEPGNEMTAEVVTNPFTEINEESVMTEKISVTSHQNSVTRDAAAEASHLLKVENLWTNVPSYFFLSNRKTGQLKFIIREFLASHILEKYNFPKEEKYKNHKFYVNVQHWAGNLSEALLMNPERIAKSFSVLLKADTDGEISAYIHEMTDEVFKKEIKRNIDLMDLEEVLVQHHSQDNEEFYTQSDMNSIKEFIKIVFYSNAHLRNAIDQSFEEFVFRSEEKKAQDLNEDRQILSSFHSSSFDKSSEKSKIYVSHYILPQEDHYVTTSQMNNPLVKVTHAIKNDAIDMETSIAASKDLHKCFNSNSDVLMFESMSACPDNYEAASVIPTISPNQANDFFNTRLLTLQKPLLDIFNAHTDRFTTSIRPVISDVLSFTTKLEYVTRIFYSNNVETSTVITKTVKTQMQTMSLEVATKDFVTVTSPHKSFLSLKSVYLNSLVKPLTPSSAYFTLNFPKSKTETDFTIDVTRAKTDTKFASILSNSLSLKSSTTVQKNFNTKTSVVPTGFSHGNEFSVTTKPIAVSHPSQPHDFSNILSTFINKLLLLQVLLLMACKKTQNSSNQAILGDHNLKESLDLKAALTSSINSLQNSTSNSTPLFDSNFINKHNFSDITKNLEKNLAFLLNKNFESRIPELQNEKISLTALFSKDNLSLTHVKDLLNNTANQYLHYNVNNNNLVLLLQNAIDVIVNTEKSDNGDALKREVSKLDHDIKELEKEILVDIDPRPDGSVENNVLSNMPILESSFATSIGISRTPSLSSIATPNIAEVMSTFVKNEPEDELIESSSVIQSLLPFGLLSQAALTGLSLQTISSFSLNSEIEIFMKEIMNSVGSKMPNEGNILTNRLVFGAPSPVIEYLSTPKSAVKTENYFLFSNQNLLSTEKKTPSYFDGEVESTKIKTSTVTVYQNLFDISQPFLTLQKTSTVVEVQTTSLPISNDSVFNSDTHSSPSGNSHTGTNLANELLKLYNGYSSTLGNYLQGENHNKISNQPDQKLPITELKNFVNTSEIAEDMTHAAENHPLNTFDVSTEEAISKSTCDGIGSGMKTNLINPSYPLPDREKGICTFRLYIRDPLICQVRVDFVKSVMIAPTEGQCVDQVFSVQGTIEAPALNSYCGTNEDHHFYIHLKNNNTLSSSTRWIDFSLNTKTNKQFYKYDILISQIRCVHEEQFYAPRGCLQYHFGSLGILKSFNFEEKEYFSDVSYHICIKKTLFGCEATFTAADGDFGIQKHNSRVVPMDSAGVGIHACARDYLAFEGLEAMNGSRRICGAKFSYVQGDSINRPVVVTTKRSFYIIEVKSGNPYSFDKYNRGPGFRLSFHQRSNC